MTFVYAIASAKSGPVKIGYSQDPQERLKQLQTGNPERLHILAVIRFKEDYLAKIAEGLIIEFLSPRRTTPKGEFFQIHTETAYRILEFFPLVHPAIDGPYDLATFRIGKDLRDLTKRNDLDDEYDNLEDFEYLKVSEFR